MKNKIVFILGIGRSGSTLLDVTLGSHPKFIGLGEIYATLRNDFNIFNNTTRTCTCGNTVNKCPFWGEVAERVLPKISRPMAERYQILLDVFNKIYGEDYIIVDSSKFLQALNTVRNLADVDLQTIYLLRDVRAWTISKLDYRTRYPQKYSSNGYYINKLSFSYGKKIRILRWLIPYLTKVPVWYFLLWYYQNRKITTYLNKTQLPHYRLSYDELGLSPQSVMKSVFNYLNQKEPTGLSSEMSKSHVLWGSTKVSDPQRRTGILYDNRWMYRHEWLTSAALLRPIMKFNATHVYGNIQKKAIW